MKCTDYSGMISDSFRRLGFVTSDSFFFLCIIISQECITQRLHQIFRIQVADYREYLNYKLWPYGIPIDINAGLCLDIAVDISGLS